MRRITALLLALALAASLTACGGTDRPAGSTGPAGENTPPVSPAAATPATAPAESAPVSSQSGSPEEPPPSEEPTPSEEPQPAIPEGAVVLYDGEHYIMPSENSYRETPAILLSGQRLAQDKVTFTQVQRKWDPDQRAFVQDVVAFHTAFGGGTMGELFTWEALNGGEPTDVAVELDEYKAQNLLPEYIWDSPILTGSMRVLNFTDRELPLKDCSLIWLMVYCSSSQFHVQMGGRELEAVDDIAAVCGTPTAAFLRTSRSDPAYIWLCNDFCMVAVYNKGNLDMVICFSLTDEALSRLENYNDVVSQTLSVLADLGLM